MNEEKVGARGSCKKHIRKGVGFKSTEAEYLHAFHQKLNRKKEKEQKRFPAVRM
jgi:hypothetical protein